MDCNSELLTPSQAAALLAVAASVLKYWRGVGGGPAFIRLSGKIVRYRRQDLVAFIAGKVRSNTDT